VTLAANYMPSISGNEDFMLVLNADMEDSEFITKLADILKSAPFEIPHSLNKLVEEGTSLAGAKCDSFVSLSIVFPKRRES